MFRSERGMTLIELVMVIIIIGIISGVAMKTMESSIETGRMESTRTEMQALSDAIVGNSELMSNGSRIDFGYVGDVGSLPPDLDALSAAPSGYATWNGPYISSNFVEATDDFKKDGWGIEYAYNGGLTITSTGSGSNITRQLAGDITDLTSNSIRGTILDVESIPPGTHSTDLDVIIEYPDGSGSLTTQTINPSPSGNYVLTGLPIGNHTVTAVYTTTNDTVLSYVTVPPRSSVINNIRFGYPLWAGGGGSGGGSGVEYVTGSAVATGGGHDVEFDITNNSGSSITIDWLEAEYTHSPTAYYERVRWDNASVVFQSNPRLASGDRANFGSSKTLTDGSTITVKLQDFNTAQSGGGSPANMSGTTFTITFSDGSSISFTI
ncbi:MAG: prepilin-type N-terminal cleavage/methylation domain-containing protein [Candidatus Zixiibacteriota bacterium]